MAIKIKRKVDRPAEADPSAPDQVYTATEETFGWIQEHRRTVVTVLVAIVVAIIAGDFALGRYQSRNVPASEALFGALGAAYATVDGDDAPPAADDAAADARETFPDTYAKLDALRERATNVATSFPQSPLEDDASMVAARAGLALGEADEAERGYADFGFARSGSVEQALTYVGRAMARLEGGNVDGALTLLDEATKSSAEVAAAAAMARAQILDAADRDQEALEAYRHFAATYPEAGGVDLMENRAAQLEIELGVDPLPEPSEEAAEPEDGDGDTAGGDAPADEAGDDEGGADEATGSDPDEGGD